MFVGVLLLLPERREESIHALVTGFRITIQTVQTVARWSMSRISEWEQERRLRKEEERSKRERST